MSKFCPHCGAEAMENTRFCDNCGNMIEQPQQNAPQPAQPPQYTPQPEPPTQYTPQPEPPPQYAPPPEQYQQPQYAPPPEQFQQPQYAPPPEQFQQPQQYAPPQEQPQQYAPPPEPPQQYAPPPEQFQQYAPPPEQPQQYAPPPEQPQQYAPPPEQPQQYAPPPEQPQQYAPPQAPPSPYAPQPEHFQQQQYQQQYSPPGGPPGSGGAKRKLPLWALIAIIVAGAGVLVGAAILIISLLSGSMGKAAEADYYEIGSDKVPSVKYVLGEVRDVISVSTSTQNGVTKKTIGYSVPDNQGAEMFQYAQTLMDKHGFYNITPYDFTDSTGKGFEFSRESDEDGYIIILEIEYNRSGYTITLSRGEGTLTIPETEPETEPEPEPETEPDSTPAPDSPGDEEELNQGTLPGAGGTASVSGPTELVFTAEIEGLWTFHTFDSGDDDPHMLLVLSNGNVYQDDDDGMGDNNSLIYVYLDAGMTVSIVILFYDLETQVRGYGPGNTSVIAKPPIDLPPGGGEIEVTAPQGYMFRPDKAGTYEFRTSNNGDGDPYLVMHDFDCNTIANDDDSGGDKNAMFTIDLAAGEPTDEYHLYAAFGGIGPQNYTLTITKK